MTASRSLILIALAAVAALALLALFLGVGRDSQMRDAEADFQAKLRKGEIGSGAIAPSSSADNAPIETASNESELSDWYADAGEPAGGRSAK